MREVTVSIEEKCINTLRFLAADAIEKARSGHPGMPLGAAPMAFVLWTRHLKHNPADPSWPDRDRFILSAGHASMLLYGLLHLTGYDLSLEDLKSFRQWGSRTPGHPERGRPPGTEMTTGPLGQGIAHAVGVAVAEAHLAARYNTPDYQVVDHYTYVMASDGDMMEGVTLEACSLAGHLGLGKLVVLYDANGVSLAGSTALTFTEDTGRHFEALNWHVQTVADGNDLDAVDAAVTAAKACLDRPSLIIVSTCIGYGAPTKGGTFACHGAPLGQEELRAAKERLGWPPDETFLVPPEVREYFRRAAAKGREEQGRWEEAFRAYAARHPREAEEFRRVMAGELPPDWDRGLPDYGSAAGKLATRRASEAVMQVLGANMPELMGGSADLNPSCLTWLKGGGDFQRPRRDHGPLSGEVGGGWGYGGRNIHFGVREHAMGAVAGGLAVHGGIRPYTATFFTFSDYMRPPMRLAALMGLPVIYIFTHDSLAVGEDGPTHQPVEQLMNLRAVPNLYVIRPCDAAETVEAWRAAVGHRRGPTVLVFTRQDVPVLDRGRLAPAAGLHRGGYVLWEAKEGLPEIILIATGSEVHPTLEAGRLLADGGRAVRVVSLPSWEIFEEQPQDYRDEVLPPAVKARLAVEAGVSLGWERYVGPAGRIVAVDRFGASAPYPVLLERFGFTPEAIAAAALSLLDAPGA
ncbi:MAG TPA: transketolase [Syntrophales bacterium]|nr:transketolase [Syntrophales bacterium]